MVKFLRNIVLDVTPEKAVELLKCNTFGRQRNINKRRLARYASEMRAGRFIAGTQIHIMQLGTEQILVNGQHTLSAIVESGVSIMLTIAYSAADSMDDVARTYIHHDPTGGARGQDDMMKALDIPALMEMSSAQSSKMYSAVRFIKSGFSRRDVSDSKEDVFSEVMEWMLEGTAFFDATKGGSATIYNAPIMAVALVTFRYQEKLAHEFWKQVAQDDGLRKNDPRKRLHELIEECKLRPNVFLKNERAITPAYLARAAATTWSAFFSGRTLSKILIYDVDREINIKGTPFVRTELDLSSGEAA
ncbi:MAG: hypothetical protein H7839_20010 [Magnetococcus sp. YQC-5]